jgi:arsenate reductase-like glutaredoxin family protein
LYKIKLYGTERCHKTQYYKSVFLNHNIEYTFLDVQKNKAFAEELCNLYPSKKLNFPTITIGKKRLRNPTAKVLFKWLQNCHYKC